MAYGDTYDDVDATDDGDDKDALIQKYLASKMGPASQASVANMRNTDAVNSQLRADANAANLQAGLNSASAMISGGRYKADNSDLMAANKMREGQIAENDQSNALTQREDSTERSKAIGEYLSGKREDARLQQSADNNAATNARIQKDSEDRIAESKRRSEEALKGLALAKQAEANRKTEHADDMSDRDASGRIDKLVDHLTSTSRGPIGQEKSKLRSVTHALSLLDGKSDKELDAIGPTLAAEIGPAMAATLTPGHPAESQVHSISPNSAQNDVAKALQYLTGVPHGSGMSAQLKVFRGMLHNQANISKGIIKQEYDPIVANVDDLKTHKKWGSRLNNVLTKNGLKFDDDGQLTAFEPSYSVGNGVPNMSGPKGGDDTAIAAGDNGGKSVVPQAHPLAPVALKWAQDPKNANDKRAKEILDRLKQPVPSPGPTPSPGG